MSRASSLFFPLILAVATLGGCHAGSTAQTKPVAGFVTDMKAFDAFIATKPTPEQFHIAYPDVMLVTPGTMTTREMRQNNSRYFPKMDAEGRIVGGSFM